jgi:hypothetical protein
VCSLCLTMDDDGGISVPKRRARVQSDPITEIYPPPPSYRKGCPHEFQIVSATTKTAGRSARSWSANALRGRPNRGSIGSREWRWIAVSSRPRPTLYRWILHRRCGGVVRPAPAPPWPGGVVRRLRQEVRMVRRRDRIPYRPSIYVCESLLFWGDSLLENANTSSSSRYDALVTASRDGRPSTLGKAVVRRARGTVVWLETIRFRIRLMSLSASWHLGKADPPASSTRPSAIRLVYRRDLAGIGLRAMRTDSCEPTKWCFFG